MNSRAILLRSLILLSTFLVACGGGIEKKGGDNGGNNGANNGANNGVSNNGVNNGVSNNGVNNGVSNNGVNNGGTNNGTSNNGGTNNGTSNNGTNNNGTNNNGTNNGTTGIDCLEASRDVLAFGAVAGSRIEPVSFQNCGTGVVRVDDVSVVGTGFQLIGTRPAFPASLSPGATIEAEVRYTEGAGANATGVLTVEFGMETLEVSLTARDVDDNCPLPSLSLEDATLGTSGTNMLDAAPLNTVLFAAVTAMGPTATSYEFAAVGRPSGSNSPLQVTAQASGGSWFLDMTGEYDLEVTALLSGTPCAETTIAKIIAVPVDDIHLEMFWDTPADGNQLDTNGTDVDLHLLRPPGSWNQNPNDVYWNNPTPDWGPAGAVGNPRLALDDTDGAGPEVIVLSDPEQLTYQYGAYYYSAGGFGPSYLSVRVYLDGTLAYHYDDMYVPAPGYFYHIASIDWPQRTATGVEMVSNGFPSP